MPAMPASSTPRSLEDRRRERAIFGDKLRTLRMRRNLTVSKLSAELGLSRDTIASYEGGRTEPQVFDAYAMAIFFGVPMDVLFLCGEHLPPLAAPKTATATPPPPKTRGK